LSQDEEHALRWLVRASVRGSTPSGCDHCYNPSLSGVHTNSDEEREKWTQFERERFGCVGVAFHPFKFKDGYELFTCPHKIRTDSSLGEYFTAFSWLEKYNQLPFGELCHQSERFMQSIRAIQVEVAAIDKENAEQAKSKMRKR